jgi:hypothetical protein
MMFSSVVFPQPDGAEQRIGLAVVPDMVQFLERVVVLAAGLGRVGMRQIVECDLAMRCPSGRVA